MQPEMEQRHRQDVRDTGNHDRRGRDGNVTKAGSKDLACRIVRRKLNDPTASKGGGDAPGAGRKGVQTPWHSSMPIQTSRWGRMKQLVSDIAAALLVAGLALSASQDAIAQVAASTATLKSVLSSRTPAPSGWREILALDGVLAFKAPKDVLVVPHFDRYSSSEFQAQGLRISFWFDANPVSLEESVVIGGRPARISDHRNFFAIFLPDVTKPTPRGIAEIKGLRLNVTHDGKR